MSRNDILLLPWCVTGAGRAGSGDGHLQSAWDLEQALLSDLGDVAPITMETAPEVPPEHKPSELKGEGCVLWLSEIEILEYTVFLSHKPKAKKRNGFINAKDVPSGE